MKTRLFTGIEKMPVKTELFGKSRTSVKMATNLFRGHRRTDRRICVKVKLWILRLENRLKFGNPRPWRRDKAHRWCTFIHQL